MLRPFKLIPRMSSLLLPPFLPVLLSPPPSSFFHPLPHPLPANSSLPPSTLLVRSNFYLIFHRLNRISRKRTNTDAVHHYDENGLANHSAEPPEIRAIHEQEVEFVKAWLEDWVAPASVPAVYV